MQGCKSPGHAQRFLAAYGPIAQHFPPCSVGAVERYPKLEALDLGMTPRQARISRANAMATRSMRASRPAERDGGRS
jgi:hypothetical protein